MDGWPKQFRCACDKGELLWNDEQKRYDCAARCAYTPFRPDMDGTAVRHGMTRFTRDQAWSRAPSPDTETVNIGSSPGSR